MRGRVEVAYGHAAAHELLRAEAGRFHGVPGERIVIGHVCPRCGSDEHGRPFLVPTASLRDPAHVSVARADDLSVVAISDVGPVGVDVEPRGAARFAGFDDVGLHPDERHARADDPTLLWVRKEALLKAAGMGLLVDPGLVRVDASGLLAWDAEGRPPGPVLLRDVDVPGHVASVVVLPDDEDARLAVEVVAR